MPAKPSALKWIDGRACIVHGERVVTSVVSETFPEDLHLHNRKLAAAGVQAFMLIVRGGYEGDFNTSWFWTDEGVYGDDRSRDDGLSLDRQAEEILAEKPDALFMVRWGSDVPKRWAEKHPNELQTGEQKGAGRSSSYASRLALEGRAALARRIVNFVESRPWGDRVVAYLPFGQDEGTPHLVTQEAMFDLCPAMQREYRTFLKDKYGCDTALRKAWQDPAASLASAAVPTDSEWQTARRAWRHWPEPAQTQRYRDYFLTVRGLIWLQRKTEMGAVRDAASRPTVVATDAFKQPMIGWLIQDAFNAGAQGMAFRNILLASGSIDVGPILDMPELDALITPADYTARSCGFGFYAEGIEDSLVLRRKTTIIEDDARSWATDQLDTQGAWRTAEEARAGLLRNLVLSSSRGLFPYWMSVGRGSFFADSDEMLKIVRQQLPLRAALLSRRREPTEHAIAMLIDDSSPLEEDFTSGFQQLAVVRQRNDHLSMTGLPFRTHLFSDVERDDFPRYRCCLLPNLFRLDADRIALVREKLMRDGAVLIFGPGTGINDGTRTTNDAAQELLGIPLELQPRQAARRVLVYGGAHPAVSGVQASLVYGDSYLYGPILAPAADLGDSLELGKASVHWRLNRAGLVLREHGRGAAGNGAPGPRGSGDCAVAFTMAAPLPAALLRSLALYGGCHAWSDLGDVVAAGGDMVAVHTVRPGARTVRLPRTCDVTDAENGQRIAMGADAFEIRLQAFDTRVFLLDPPRG